MLYNECRPTSLAGILGQDKAVRVLRGAVRRGIIPSSFIFEGPSGVGKTSTARILVKLLNCETQHDDPCGQCPACLDDSLAVYQEYDSSTLNKGNLDKVLERLAFKTQNYKVIVFDEAQNLDEEGQGKLLKITEETPPGVVFVFNTTDLSKISDTLQSRSMRLHFYRMPTEVIIEGLKAAVQIGGYAIEEPALMSIAKVAEGNMREAIKLMEQCWLATPDGEAITEQIVATTLGGAGETEILNLLLLLKARDPKDDLKAAFESVLSAVHPYRLVHRLFQVLTNVVRFQFNFHEGVDSAYHDLYGRVVRAYGADIFKLLRLVNDPMVSRPRAIEDLYLSFVYIKSTFGGFTVVDRRSQMSGDFVSNARSVSFSPNNEPTVAKT